MACSLPNLFVMGNISLGRTDLTVRAQTVSDCLKLVAAFNTVYLVKFPFFARFLAVCRARAITIPSIGLGSLHSNAPKPIVGIVIARARHSAKNRAKTLIVSKKSFFNHRAPMQ
jgi:hypothetical protein